MRKQYFFRQSPQGLLAWDVDRLIELSRTFPRKHVRIDVLGELDREWHGDDGPPTWRQLLEHVKLINAADLTYPIILSASGAVMDGRHRIAKAALRGDETIECVQFDEDPLPDHVGTQPDELPY